MKVVGDLEIFNSSFHWKIQNFNSLDATIGARVFSPPFTTTHPSSRKLQWQLVFHPSGCDEKNRDYMGLGFTCLSECEVSAIHTFSILDKHSNILVEFPANKEYTCKKNQVVVMKKFFRKDLVYDATRRGLINDTLTISCTITVPNAALNEECYDVDESARVHFENLLESGVMSDVTFKIEDKQMHLHKVILTSLSPVFFAEFQHSMKEKETDCVEIPDIKYEVMKELFRYIYVRKVNDIENIADDLLVAANKYDVKGLKMWCENILSADLSVDNAVQHLELAFMHNASGLKTRAIEFIVNRLEEFVDKPEFVQMDKSHQQELFRAIARNKVKNVQ